MLLDELPDGQRGDPHAARVGSAGRRGRGAAALRQPRGGRDRHRAAARPRPADRDRLGRRRAAARGGSRAARRPSGRRACRRIRRPSRAARCRPRTSTPGAPPPRWTRCGSSRRCIERWDESPPALTRAGGLPVRELRGAAKALGVEQDVIALIVQTVSAASLVGRTAGVDPVMVPTERYDRWRDAPMAERWALLATAWCGMDQLPGLAVHEDGTKAGRAAHVRHGPARRGRAAPRRAGRRWPRRARATRPISTGLPAWLRWRVPTRSGRYIEQVCAWTLAEAQFLGVTGRGALTSAGRRLLDSPHAAAARSGDETAARAYRDDVAEALAPALPAPIEHVLIQADLTAVAPGPLRPAHRPRAGAARRRRIRRGGDRLPVLRGEPAPGVRRRPQRDRPAPADRTASRAARCRRR